MKSDCSLLQAADTKFQERQRRLKIGTLCLEFRANNAAFLSRVASLISTTYRCLMLVIEGYTRVPLVSFFSLFVVSFPPEKMKNIAVHRHSSLNDSLVPHTS